VLEKIKSNETLLSIIGIFVLIILVVGITYAGFSQTTSGGNNSISSGIISMSFQEPSNNVVITNAMPTSNGYSSGTHFDFSVSGTAKAQMTLPYEITITEKSGNTLAASNVRIGLKKNGSIVTGFESGKLASTLTSSTVRSGSKTLYKDGLVLAQSESNYTATDNYQLFLWLSEDYEMPSDGSTESYSVTVNVNSNVGGVGIPSGTTKYVVSNIEMQIGSILPNGVNARDTAALAMSDWESIIGTSEPYYFKTILNSSNEVDDVYIEFIINDSLKAQWKENYCYGDLYCESAYDNLINGTYTLKGGDYAASYASNINVIKAAFNYAAQPDVCYVNPLPDLSGISCYVEGIGAETYDDGSAVVSDHVLNSCQIYYDGRFGCEAS